MASFSSDKLIRTYVDWAKNYTISFLLTELTHERTFISDNLESQLKFFGRYIFYPYNDGIKYSVIKNFLNKQTTEKDRSKYYIQLEGGYPTSVMIAVDEIKEIDLADSQSITEYSEINIYNKFNRKWNNTNALKIVNEVKSDLEFDGETVSIKWKIKNNTLMLKIKF